MRTGPETAVGARNLLLAGASEASKAYLVSPLHESVKYRFFCRPHRTSSTRSVQREERKFSVRAIECRGEILLRYP
jgi:hypothetical protein